MSPSEKKSQYARGWADLMKLVRNGHSWSGKERNRFFRNDQQGHFYEMSHLAGLDQSEDGRALAIVDWDQDGRLDLWYRNRSAPRLRFMHNQHESEPALSLKLEGTQCNRDGIGAVVELLSSDENQAPLVRSVRAGDLFLSQSSKVLHFGTGDQSTTFTARVLWPGGAREEFPNLPAQGRFLLKQGSGKAVALAPRETITFPSTPELMPLRDQGNAHIILPARVPFPKLTYDTPEQGKKTIAPNGQAKLLILSSENCLHCQKLLPEIEKHTAAFKAAQLAPLSLSVDALSGEKPLARASIDAASATLLFRFQERLFDRTPASTVPLAILLDRSNQALAIYRGPFSIPGILADWHSLRSAHPIQLHHLAPPLKGTWFTNPLPPQDVRRMFPAPK